MSQPSTEVAIFAAGCFWGVEEAFRTLPGVLTTSVGYTGGTMPDPTYHDVCEGDTGHAEAVRIEFDPAVISFEKLASQFFALHDPTTLNRQGPDVGEQYRSAVFYTNDAQRATAERLIKTLTDAGVFPRPIVTQVVPEAPYFPAEEYHQKYLLKRGLSNCHI
ncbi:MAG: peptide-methionine (S)-S-oxide reductase MsrA [Fimbriimonadaceae bacterium]|nr:peptide-methionine (S)-S-oxide reductase MsrA [Fimbriimonadaceae bacterium]